MEAFLSSNYPVILQPSSPAISFDSDSLFFYFGNFEFSKQVLFNIIPSYQSQEKKR